MKVDIWHNILWSKYKGAVFSALYRASQGSGIEFNFFQIAEAEGGRGALSGVDLSYHQYPFQLIFKGSHDDVPKLRLIATLFRKTFASRAAIVVLAGYHKPEYWAQLLAARLSKKKVMTFCDSTAYDNPPHIVKDFLKRVFFRQCAGFFGYGQRSREYVVSYGIPESRIYTRCQAAALLFDYDPSQALAERIALLRERPAPVILYVGRLAREKNLSALIEAFARLAESHPQCLLKFVGAGPERAALEVQGASLGLSDRIIFAGSLSGAPLFAEYARAACLALPSLSEPWGLVVNEALSYGCPVVVSDRCGCIPELVVEGVTGYRFDPGSVDELAGKLGLLLRPDFDFERAACACLEVIGAFTPDSAAGSIMAGVAIVGKDDAHKRNIFAN